MRRTLAPLLALCLLGLVLASGAQAAGGTALGWGYNASGQVGNGTVGGGVCSCVDVPAAVTDLQGVTQIAGGYEHGLAVLDDGTVMAWGYNDSGQLGDGSENDRSTPAPVPGLTGVIAVSAGSESSLALLADGTVKAWGKNLDGALGDGDPTGPSLCGAAPCRRLPAPVPGVSEAIAIASGGEYNLALRADGTVLAWGEDEYGTLGDGTGVAAGCKCVPTATQIPGLAGVVAISAGDLKASALLSDGTIRVWGYNKEGELGTGVKSPAPPCTCLGPTAPNGVTAVRQVASGGGHQLALLSGGAAQGWGYNTDGQLGLGFDSGPVCECVPDPTTIPGLAAAELTAGYEHSLALLSNGTGLSWGEGAYGQLGGGASGAGSDKNIPTPISSLAGASELTATLYGGYAIVGPSQKLEVTFAGAGAGRVGGGGILCPPSCTDPQPQGQVKTLRAVPDPGSGFAGFSGPCTGTGTCQVKMGGDQTVTATFGPPKGTAIAKSDINSKKKKATFSFSAPGAITGYECKLVKPKAKKKKKGKGTKKRVELAKKGDKEKPKPVTFSACAGPKAYKNLKPGKYTFEVRALDILGADAVPAVKKFKIKKPKPRKRRA
jgi:alpha-tubulin suppressor-like RCC1 family protein